MPLMTWSDSYSINSASLDQQHQKLFSLVNQLYDSLHLSKDEVSLDKTLDALIAYARVHFIEEEVEMMKSNYPELVEHQEQHDYFIRRVFELQSDYRDGHFDVAISLLDFLAGWLSSHVLKADKAIGIYIDWHKTFESNQPLVGGLQGLPG